MDTLQRTARESYNFSMVYTPGTKTIHNRVEDEMDRERVALVDAFRKIEQGTDTITLQTIPSADLSVAALPAAFAVVGKNFGTVNTDVYIQVGDDATLVQAAAAGFTTTTATFDISGLTLTAAKYVLIRLVKKDTTYPTLKWMYSNAIQGKTVV